MRRFKQITITVVLCISICTIFTQYVNRNSVNMTTKQKVLKAFYPALMWINKLTGTNNSSLKKKPVPPTVSFYSLQTTLSDGSSFDFSGLKGKKILLVNTASECGYTDQYAELEKLYQHYKVQVEILAFPANDFKEQEKGNDAAIAQFCRKNYGVTFPLMAKSVVIKSGNQNPVFNWLTNPASNGWNSKAPSWNFSKYLINERGELTNYFDPGISPMAKEVIDAIIVH
jgi:glutathione peroxidase